MQENLANFKLSDLPDNISIADMLGVIAFLKQNSFQNVTDEEIYRILEIINKFPYKLYSFIVNQIPFTKIRDYTDRTKYKSCLLKKKDAIKQQYILAIDKSCKINAGTQIGSYRVFIEDMLISFLRNRNNSIVKILKRFYKMDGDNQKKSIEKYQDYEEFIENILITQNSNNIIYINNLKSDHDALTRSFINAIKKSEKKFLKAINSFSKNINNNNYKTVILHTFNIDDNIKIVTYKTSIVRIGDKFEICKTE